MITLIKMLLAAAALFAGWLGIRNQRKLGEDRYVRKQLEDLAERTGVARRIEERVERMSDSDVDDVLQRYYRNEGKDSDK